MKFKVKLDGQEHELEVTRQGEQIWVTHEGRVIPLRLLHQDGAYRVVEVEPEDSSRPQLRLALHAHGQNHMSFTTEVASVPQLERTLALLHAVQGVVGARRA